MSKFKRIEVAQAFLDTSLVPVFYHADVEVAKAVVKACYEGGTRVFEFTNRGDGAHEVFAELLKWVRQELPDLKLGIGSVIDAPTTALFLQLGADFIVSPLMNPEMAKICNRRKVLWSPGCGSVSEISQAEELGAEIVKIFPGAEVGGPAFVKGVLGPLRWSLLMPTGGVEPTEESLSAWFSAGVVCVGMGSKLITKDIMAAKDWPALTAKVKGAMEIVAKCKA